MNALPELERAKRDGCGCPPWAIRCAHFPSGNILWLSDWEVGQCSHSKDYRAAGAKFVRYGVNDRNSVEMCEEGFPHSRVTDRIHCGDDPDAALAAFHEAEARLLGREALRDG